MSWHRANIRNRRCGHEGGSTGTSRSGDDHMGTAGPLLAALAIEKSAEKNLVGRNSARRSSSGRAFSPPWRAKGIGIALCSPCDSRRETLSKRERALAHAALGWEKTSREKKLRRSGRFRPETEGAAKPAADKAVDHARRLAPEPAEQAGDEERFAVDRPGAACSSPCAPRPGRFMQGRKAGKGGGTESRAAGTSAAIASGGTAADAAHDPAGPARARCAKHARRSKGALGDPDAGEGRSLGGRSTSIALATCGKRKTAAQLRWPLPFRSAHPAHPVWQACPTWQARPTSPACPARSARQDPPGARRMAPGQSGGPDRKSFRRRGAKAACRTPTLQAWLGALKRIPSRKRHDAWKATWDETSPLGPHTQAAAQKGRRQRRRKAGTPVLIGNIAYP